MSPGFTLIEISIVMAIVSGLVIIAFLGQGELRSNAQFNDAVDSVVADLSATQNDANTALNTNELAPGTRGNLVFFGMLAEFKKGTSELQITPYYKTGDACPATGPLTKSQSQQKDIQIPWGTIIETGNHSIMFARSCIDGGPRTFIPRVGEVNLGESATYNVSEPSAVIKLNNQRGRCANITVGKGAGNITKEYVTC